MVDATLRGTFKILVVDRDPLSVHGLALLVARHPGIALVAAAGSLEEAIPLIDEHLPAVVLAELNLGGRSGAHLAEYLAVRHPGIRLTLMSIAPEETLDELAERLRVELVHKSDVPEWLECIAESNAAIRPIRPVEKLSGRETEVARLVARGMSSSEIAAALGISSETVKTYAARAMAKFQVRSRVELAINVLGLSA